MEILSFNENPSIAQEANQLCRWIEQNAATLRAGRPGETARFGKNSIRLLQIGRNAVYRIHGSTRWYLKMPCNGKTGGIEGEISGFRYIKDAFQQLDFYQHPAAVRASLEEKYLLSAEVSGKQLNYQLYRACLRPMFSRADDLKKIFYRCGMMLGQFHKFGRNINLPEASSLDLSLRRRLRKAKSLDKTGEKISRWLENYPPPDVEKTMVHGNCTFRNILAQEYRLSILDFETCGSGSRYDDLARICSDIVLCRAVFAFPWKRAYAALAAFLKGYGQIFPLNREILLRYIALYIFDRYIQVYGIKKAKETVSGIPVSQTRLAWLHQRLLAADVESVLPNTATQSVAICIPTETVGTR